MSEQTIHSRWNVVLSEERGNKRSSLERNREKLTATHVHTSGKNTHTHINTPCPQPLAKDLRLPERKIRCLWTAAALVHKLRK